MPKNYTYPDWVTHHTPYWKKWLAEFVGKPVVGLEIGSFEGRSASWLLENVLTHEHSCLICIDPWFHDWYGGKWPEGAEQRFDQNVAEYGQRVMKYKGFSKDVLPDLRGEVQVAFAYIDGSHHGDDILRDAIYCWDMLLPGGAMILDDYHWNNKNVPVPPKPAIDALMTVLRHDRPRAEISPQQACIFKPR